MERLTVKELQKKCKEAGLKATGNKQTLINRLESCSVKNRTHGELTQRIRELEATIVRLQTQSENESEEEETIKNNFHPMSTSTVRPVNLATRMTTVQTPLVSTTAFTSNFAGSVPQYVRPETTSVCYTAGAHPPTTAVNNAQMFVPQYLQQPENKPFYYSTGASLPTTMVQHPQAFVPQQHQHQMGYAVEPLFTNVKDIVAVLPEFNPMADDSLTSQQFIQRIQLLKDAYQWRDDLLIFAVQQKLKGYAKLWIDSQREVYTTWHQFSTRLLQAFPFDNNAATAHIRMANTKRKVDELPQEFYFRMLAMGTKLGLPEDAVARHIINGVNDNDLKKKISNEYTSCAALLRDIESYCRYNEVRVSNFKNKEYVSSFTEKPISNDVQNTAGYPNAPKHIKCYNCGKYGHIASKCREPKKTARDAEPNKNQVNKVEAVNSVKPDIVKEVEINGQKLTAFVDPGSTHTLIRSKIANKLGGLEQCDITLNGFGGGEYHCQRKLVADVAIDGHLLKIELLIVDDQRLTYDVLVGRDVLCQQGKRFIIENNACRMENVEVVSAQAPDIKGNEFDKLMHILSDHKGCFAENIFTLGKCSIMKMTIKVNSDLPIKVKPYRIAFALRDKVKDMIGELLQADIIRPSTSPYASPVVVVPKKNDELRLCVDYRQLNKITEKEPFPMPIIDEHLAQLAGNVFFSIMDFRMGYHQVEVEEEAKKYTAFVTMDGHYEYNRMPFGLVNAPAVFQSIMNVIAAKMEPGEILTYLDDVIIPSKSVEVGLQRLEKFLTILSQAGLTLRLDKCRFLAKEISYLGHDISARGISPGPQKVSAVRNFAVPENVTEVRRFLGLTGFFRKFIKDYAIISKPLTCLLHKSEENKFRWELPQDQAFHKLIEILCSKPVLALYDFHASHEIHTDASSVGLAGVLLQSTNGEQWQPVFYFSRQCTDTESRYHSYELETLAVVETLTRFRIYLLGKPFRLVTDCAAIAKARAQKELIPKIARWYMRLLEFDFEVIHRPAERLAHVDALSRMPDEPPSEIESAGFVMKITDEDWLLTMQLQDVQLANIIAVLKGEQNSVQEKQIKTDYKLHNARLYRKANGLQLVVPKRVRWRIVKLCHDDVGHFGLEKTIARIQQHFWFPRIRKYVREYLTACVECCYNKTQGGKPEGRLHHTVIEPIPFATLHVDHLGPFVKSGRGMLYALVISDAFSKYLVIEPVRNTKTGPVIVALKELTSYFGLPKRLVSDRGTAFTSKGFEDFCGLNDIQHIKTAVRTPRANGQVERANQLVLTFLRTTTESPRNWDLKLRELQWAINSQKNATSGFTPNELVFDFNLRDNVHNHILAAVHDDQTDEQHIPIDEKRLLAAKRIDEEREKWKARFDNRHKQPTIYNVNDLVVVENEPTATGESRKLEPKYRGPYMISKVLGNDRYVLVDVPGVQITQRKFDSVYAAHKLKPWCSGYPDLYGDEDLEDDSNDSVEDDTQAG